MIFVRNSDMDMKTLFIAVHAGAGTHAKENEPTYKAVCKAACLQAMALLKERRSALECVTAAVSALEDAECTNAGLGSNLTMEGNVECDSSVMDGKTLFFGAVGALSGVKNPIKVAHRLAEEQKLGPLPLGRVRPSILVGTGAQDYCKTCSIDVRSNILSKTAFKTYNRYKRKYQLAELSLAHPSKKMRPNSNNKALDDRPKDEGGVQDTVGAVCVDYEGNVAAASSSGGIWLKHSGRLGPAAIYGAGCWAQNQVSASKAGVAAVTSGCGEHLIQTLLAKTCSDAIRSSTDLSGSLATVFQDDFLGSEFLRNTEKKFGGVLALKTHSDGSDRDVELSWMHSTASMSIGYMNGSKNSPTVLMSRLDDSASPGRSYTLGGHMLF
ncbi:hypothetical protein EGW08_011242 [Elysia chlorotica]|uniref:Uncharacterized protein n=1 Tax=Elysia chlorotica TaxID=188477 RepID=A0A433THG7_ELYCH|nr:hypothetical protein EGW08_011242 [Elysia chlorotica]